MNYQNNETTKSNNLNKFLLFIMITLLALNLFVKNNIDTKVTLTKKSVELPPVFETYAQRADESIRNSLQQFNQQMDSKCDYYNSEADRFARKLAEEACTYSNCLTLIKYLAFDYLQDTNEANSYLNSLLQDSMNNKIAEIQKDINGSFEKLQDELMANTKNYAQKMSAILPKSSKLHFDSRLTYTQQDFKNLATEFGLLETINVAFLVTDIGYIVSSSFFSTLRNTISRLAMAAFKAPLKKAIASIGISLVDGPLPIGDIIGCIGLAWTAYDIKCERDEFEKNVKNSIYNQLTEVISEVRCQAQKTGENVSLQHQEMRITLKEAFEKEYLNTIQ